MTRKKADISSKRLISLAPDAWIQWLLERPDLQARGIFSSDFQWVGREGDVLVKANSSDLGEFLVLNEIQLRYSSDVPRRMAAYAALAREKYKLPVYPVVVNILETESDEIASSFSEVFFEVRSLQEYRVINLWEVDAAIAFDRNLTTLLPFVPVLRGGGNERAIARALQKMRTQNQPAELESVLGFFASYVLNSEIVQRILRLDMAILEQSPLYRELVERSEQRGIAIGEQRGEQRRARQIALSMLQAGMSVEQTAQLTELTVEDVSKLREENAASEE